MEIYKFDTVYGFEKIEVERFSEAIEDKDYYVGYLTIEQLETYDEILRIPERVYEVLRSGERLLKNHLIVEEKYSFGNISIINEDFLQGTQDVMGLYLEKNRFLIISLKDADHSIKNRFHDLIESSYDINSPGKFLNKLIGKLVSHHAELYTYYRNLIEDMDDKILSNDFSDEIIRDISQTNHSILRVYTNYERLVDFCEPLIENTNNIILEEDIKHFTFIAGRVQRYSDNFEHLRDYLGQVRSSYTSQMDYQLNTTMRFFTLISTIFLPLTLLVGWYGMNFTHMPELNHPYGYRIVIAFAILIVIVSVYIFKKRKWL